MPEICDGLAELAEPLWAAADSPPLSGRALFAAQLPSPDRRSAPVGVARRQLHP
ncbi:MAG: hypothetical protein R2697_11020 [Ilumatobacteraceae bacterium]